MKGEEGEDSTREGGRQGNRTKKKMLAGQGRERKHKYFILAYSVRLYNDTILMQVSTKELHECKSIKIYCSLLPNCSSDTNTMCTFLSSRRTVK